jgi:hypothetical protein
MSRKNLSQEYDVFNREGFSHPAQATRVIAERLEARLFLSASGGVISPPPSGVILPITAPGVTIYTELPPVIGPLPSDIAAPSPPGVTLPLYAPGETIFTQEPPIIVQMPPNFVAPNSPVVPFKTSVAAVSSADPGQLSTASGRSGLFNTEAVITADAIFASTDSILD